MDLLKHGESAYPADAWVEQQYMREDAFSAVSDKKTYLALQIDHDFKSNRNVTDSQSTFWKF